MPVTWVHNDQADWQILNVTDRDPADSTSARHWVQRRIAVFGEEHRIDTLLVAGELLENAYRHAGGPTQVRLRLRHHPCEITVAVADNNSGVPRRRVPDDGGGRGLVLVDQICSSWGVSHHDDGKLVWGRVGCAGTGFACPSPPNRGNDVS